MPRHVETHGAVTSTLASRNSETVNKPDAGFLRGVSKTRLSVKNPEHPQTCSTCFFGQPGNPRHSGLETSAKHPRIAGFAKGNLACISQVNTHIYAFTHVTRYSCVTRYTLFLIYRCLLLCVHTYVYNYVDTIKTYCHFWSCFHTQTHLHMHLHIHAHAYIHT